MTFIMPLNLHLSYHLSDKTRYEHLLATINNGEVVPLYYLMHADGC
jgi:hypothetical protein